MSQYKTISQVVIFSPEKHNQINTISKAKSTVKPQFLLKDFNLKKSARSISSSAVQAKRAYSSLNPTIPHKKLNQTPQFFKSLQKRKKRVLSTLQNNTLVEYQTYIQEQISSPKKIQGVYRDYLYNFPVQNNQLYGIEHQKSTHIPQALGPHININLQMIIKRRRPSDPLSTNRHTNLISSVKRKNFGPSLSSLN